MQNTKFERLSAMLENVIQMKFEHLIHMKAKSERQIYRRQSLNLSTVVLENVRQMKFEHLIHMKAKSERLICRRRSLNV